MEADARIYESVFAEFSAITLPGGKGSLRLLHQKISSILLQLLMDMNIKLILCTITMRSRDHSVATTISIR